MAPQPIGIAGNGLGNGEAGMSRPSRAKALSVLAQVLEGSAIDAVADQDLAFSGVIWSADHAFLLHPFDQ